MDLHILGDCDAPLMTTFVVISKYVCTSTAETVLFDKIAELYTCSVCYSWCGFIETNKYN